MFEKDLTKPTILLQYEALLARMDKNHEKYPEIDKKRAIYNAGYTGEKILKFSRLASSKKLPYFPRY